MAKVPGLIKGLGITFGTMMRTFKNGSNTVQYPHEKETPPRREGGKPRQVNMLDRFDIDYALCMYCGICVEVCPFDALFWSPEYEYSEPNITDLLHDKTKLSEWMETVPEAPELEVGADKKKK
jgi:NADH-quinone oxidoreductase subunit I